MGGEALNQGLWGHTLCSMCDRLIQLLNPETSKEETKMLN